MAATSSISMTSADTLRVRLRLTDARRKTLLSILSWRLASYEPFIYGAAVMATKGTATLSAQFQILILKAIRTARHWQAGQLFAFIPKGGGMLLVPVPTLEQLAGLARGAKPDDYRDRIDRP